MIMKKRGQAAMEFLMTYGWAILAAIIVVGVLWYLIGSPGNLAGNRFQISAPLVEKGFTVNTTYATLNVLNGAGDTIHVKFANLTSANCGAGTGAVDIVIGVGSEGSIIVPCGNTKGSRLNSDVLIEYTEGTSTFLQQATGSVSGKIP